MGYVDTLTRFTHYNSYRLDPGEELFGTPFDVEFFSAINSQAQVICKGATSEGAMYMTWLAEDGSKLSRDEYEFDVTGRWVRQIWPNEPPEHAVRAMWSVKNTDDTEAWNVACAMTSAGEMAGAFDPSLASQVSLLNAQGLYTGIVSANQVIAGILQSLDGKAYFDLEKPEIVMEGEQADLSITPENPLKLTDKQGNFIGGLGVADGRLGLVANMMTNDPNMNVYATIGRPAEGGRGIAIYEKNYPDVYIGRYGTAFGISIDHKPRLQIGDGTLLLDKNGVIRVQIGDNTFLIDKDDVVRLWIDSDGNTFLQNAANSHAIGVDNTGPYYIKNNVKTYF